MSSILIIVFTVPCYYIVKYTNRQVLKIAQSFVSFADVHFTYWLFLRFADPLVDYIYPLKNFIFFKCLLHYKCIIRKKTLCIALKGYYVKISYICYTTLRMVVIITHR